MAACADPARAELATCKELPEDVSSLSGTTGGPISLPGHAASAELPGHAASTELPGHAASASSGDEQNSIHAAVAAGLSVLEACTRWHPKRFGAATATDSADGHTASF